MAGIHSSANPIRATNRPPAAPIVVVDYGFTTLSSGGPSPLVDIVFVHGLGGHPQTTWSGEKHGPKASAEPSRPKKPLVGDNGDKKSQPVRDFFRKKILRKKESGGAQASSSSSVGQGQVVSTDIHPSGDDDSGSVSSIVLAGAPTMPTSSPRPPTGTIVPTSPLSAVDNPTNVNNVFWPLDFLSSDFEDLRILSFGYESNPTHSTQNNLYTLSKSLLQKLAGERVNCTTRPLIFVCHSLGGILVKFALKLAQDSSGIEESFQTVRRATKGVIFFATPHSGADIADWGEMLRRIAGVFKVTNSPLLAALNAQNDNGQLEQLRDDFSKMLGRWNDGKLRAHALRESKPLYPVSSKTLIVPLASSHIASEWASNITIDDANHRNICKFGGSDDPNYRLFKDILQGYLKDIADEPAATLNQQLDAAQLRQINESKNSCLEKLDFPQSKKAKKATQGTCLWMSGNSLFETWTTGSTGLLWLQGKAGSGKSTLMRHLYEIDRRNAADRYPRVMVLFFSFFSQSRGPESSMKGLLRSLIRQIILYDDTLSGPAIAAWQKESSKGGKAVYWDDLDELKEVLIETLSCGPGRTRVSIYVDALNECEEYGESWVEDIEFLFETLAGPEASTRFQAKLMLSSQPTPRLSQALGALHTPTIVLEDCNTDDIGTYLDRQARPFQPLEPEFESILGKIRSQADGLFLWVSLIWENFLVKQLEKRSMHGVNVSMEELEAILSSPLPKLDEVFRRMLDKVEADLRPGAISFLKIATCTVRPLTIEEFRYALALGSKSHNFKSEKDMLACRDFPKNSEDATKQIRSKSGGLLEIRILEDNKKSVQFIHDQAKVYILNLVKVGPIFSFGEVSEDGHVYLSRACTNWIAIEELSWLHQFYGREAPSFFHAYMCARDHFYFVEYAFSFWLHHIREAERSTQQSQAQFLLNGEALFLAMYHGLGRGTFIATGWMDFWVPWTVIRGQRDARENVLGTPGPLCVAISCRLSLTAADIITSDPHSSYEGGGFPIQCAFMNEQYDMVLMLIEHDARIRWLAHKATTDSLDGIRNPLRAWIVSRDLSSRDTESSRILELLLDKGFELPHPDEADLGSALSLAIVVGKVDIIKMLLRRSLNHDTFEPYLTSGFFALAALGHNHDPETTSKILSALLELVKGPVPEGHLLIRRNVLQKSLQLLQSVREAEEVSQEAEVDADNINIDDKPMGYSDFLAVLLFSQQKAMEGQDYSQKSDKVVLEEFLASPKPEGKFPSLMINRDGPVLWPGEENFFSPSLPAGVRRGLLQTSESPLFQGRPSISERHRARSDDARRGLTLPIRHIFL